jgi:hypothetical protein
LFYSARFKAGNVEIEWLAPSSVGEDAFLMWKEGSIRCLMIPPCDIFPLDYEEAMILTAYSGMWSAKYCRFMVHVVLKSRTEALASMKLCSPRCM